MYFVENDDTHQSKKMIAQSLLTQAAEQMDHISPVLERWYSNNKLPEFDDLLEALKDACNNICSPNSRELYVIFDGLDECSPNRQNEIGSLIRRLLGFSGVRVYITTRPKTTAETCITSDFPDPFRIQIAARVEDINNYLTRELGEYETISQEFKEKIVERISEEVEGM